MSLSLAERQRIAEDHLPLARAMARRFVQRYRLSRDFEEFEAAALQGIWAAALAYRGGPVAFSVYCRKWIFGEMYEHRVWLLCWLRADPTTHVEFSAELDSPRDDRGPALADLREDAEAFIAGLPAQLRELASRLLLGGLTKSEAARDLGISPARVTQLWQRIRARSDRSRKAS